MSEGHQYRPSVWGDTGSCPWSRGLDQLPRGGSGRVQVSVAWSRCPWPLGPMPEVPWDAPALPGHSGPCPMSRGLDQLSQATRACACGPPVLTRVTRARFRRPAGSTSCPGRHGPVSKGLWGRQPLPGGSRSRARDRGVDQLSQVARARVLGHEGTTSYPGRHGPGSEGPRGRPAVPGDSGTGPSSLGVEQLSRTTRT